MKSQIYQWLRNREDDKRNNVINLWAVFIIGVLLGAYVTFEIMRPIDANAFGGVRATYQMTHNGLYHNPRV